MFDYQKILRFIEAQAKLKRPIRESMARLINKCQAQRPHPDWNKLRELDYSDLPIVENWITHNFTFDPPDFTLQGVSFALVTTERDEGLTLDLVLGGTADFNWKNEDDYPLSYDQFWEPGEDHLQSEVLSDIYRIAYHPQDETSLSGRLENDAEYSISLGYAVFAITETLQNIDPQVILRDSDAIGVNVGFYGGDAIAVGKVLSTGFRNLDD